MKLKRLFDLIFAVMGVILLFPLLAVLALWIKKDSSGPVFFWQERIGRFGKPFRICKFRTMVINAEAMGLKITLGGDPRITRAGIFLRKYKLDELPQLFNILKGEMSFVGPRPEVAAYVAYYKPEIKDLVFSVPPGITDFAAIEFRNENEIIADAVDPHRTYVEQILPIKLAYYEKYVRERSLWMDLILIVRTVLILGR